MIEMHPDVLCMQEYQNIENAKRHLPFAGELDPRFQIFLYLKDRAGAYPKNPSVWLEEGCGDLQSVLPLLSIAEKVCINAAYKAIQKI